MSKMMKKVLSLALALTVFVTIVPPATAEAAVSYPGEVTFYRSYKSNDYWTSTSFRVDGLTKSTKIYPKSLKSSDATVMVPYYFEKYSSSDKYSYVEYSYDYDGKLINEKDPYKYESNSDSYYAYVGALVKEAGKATMSYKIGSKTYKTKVNALAYTNPLKTVKITGINSGKNIANKLNNQYTTNVTLNSTKKKATVQVAAKSGWVIRSVYAYDSKTGTDYEISNYGEKGVGNTTLNVGTLTKKQYAYVRLYCVNTKNNAGMYCYYYINNN